MREIEVTTKMLIDEEENIDISDIVADITKDWEEKFAEILKSFEVTEIRDRKVPQDEVVVKLPYGDVEVIAASLDTDADKVLEELDHIEMSVEDMLTDIGTADHLRSMAANLYEQIGQPEEARKLYEMIPEDGPEGSIGVDWAMLQIIDGQFGEGYVENGNWDVSYIDGVLINLATEEEEDQKVFIKLEQIDSTCAMGRDMLEGHKKRWTN